MMSEGGDYFGAESLNTYSQGHLFRRIQIYLLQQEGECICGGVKDVVKVLFAVFGKGTKD